MDTDKIRTILNILFLIGAVVSVALYFLVEDKHPFIYVCIGALCLKIAEFFIRFMF